MLFVRLEMSRFLSDARLFDTTRDLSMYSSMAAARSQQRIPELPKYFGSMVVQMSAQYTIILVSMLTAELSLV